MSLYWHCCWLWHCCHYTVRNTPTDTPLTFTGRSYRHYNRDDMLEYLTDIDWTAFHSSHDPNEQWLFIYDALISYLDVCCPIRTVALKKRSDPWVTPETMELINDRYDVIKEKRNTNNRALSIVINRMKNRIHRQLQNAKGTSIRCMEGSSSSVKHKCKWHSTSNGTWGDACNVGLCRVSCGEGGERKLLDRSWLCELWQVMHGTDRGRAWTELPALDYTYPMDRGKRYLWRMGRRCVVAIWQSSHPTFGKARAARAKNLCATRACPYSPPPPFFFIYLVLLLQLMHASSHHPFRESIPSTGYTKGKR